MSSGSSQTTRDGLDGSSEPTFLVKLYRFLAYRLLISNDLLTRLYISILRLFSSNGLVLRNVNGHDMYLKLADPGISRTLIMHNLPYFSGRHEKEMTDVFCEEVTEGMTMVEIGANIGYYTLIAADEFGPSGTVHAIEPVPENHEILRKNLEINGYGDIATHNLAISDSEGETEMILTEESNWGSIVDPDEGNVSQHRREKMREKREGSITVPTTTVDKFVSETLTDDVDVFRMDIEGAEEQAIAGMAETLQSASAPCKLFIEIHNNAFDEPEEKFGPMLDTILDAGFVPKLMVVNSERTEIGADVFREEFFDYDDKCPHVLFEKRSD